ncbi:MAG: 2-phosphosulfolactate phosphatase [Verrucomicrobiae bacterium]|nr:2-phosphosulfolactate phosphatase [Verrucomicrobiae bacterium]
MRMDVYFTPAEFGTLSGEGQPGTVCVVFDVLRATSTAITALDNGASGVVPVVTIEEALEARRRDGDCLLAGERDGWRIGPEWTGGTGFDLGNSPREFTRERVAGRRIVLTTTNGTRALRACAGAERVLAGAFLNLGAVAGAIRGSGMARVLAVCSGTGERVAYEDVLVAGALCGLLEGEVEFEDGAWLALAAWRMGVGEPDRGVRRAGNARRLLGREALAGDVAWCLRQDTTVRVPELRDGVLR